MSGIEITGLAIGVLASLQQAVDAAERLKRRFQKASRNIESIFRLLDTYSLLSDHLKAIQVQYEGKSCALTDDNHRIFEHHINHMQQSFQSAAKTLKRLQDSQSTSFFTRFLRATSTHERLETLQSDAERAASFVVQINSFLANADVTEHTAQLQTTIITKRIDDLERTISPRSADFSPSFVVPRNPLLVDLGYESVDSNGEPKYCEGRLLRSVLRGGVVCAVGMGGVGKSCALRGLAENNQIRDRFDDGVYYMQLGMEARVGAALEQLCEMMELSGGHDYAKVTRGERSLLVVLGRVRRWFEGRDCLFLVDDVWLVNDIDAGVLPKISVLAGCSKNSALAFTTRDKRLATLGEPIFFNPRETLGEQSRRILLRAARYNVAEVVEESGRRAVDKVLSVCAGLPVALAVVGNAVFLLSSMYQEHREKAWSRYVSAQSTCAQNAVKREIHEYPGLAATFSAALHILADDRRARLSIRSSLSFQEMHRALCVLRKQGWASVAMLSRLWHLETGTAALDVANLFAQVSMVELELREERGEEFETVRLHDLVQEFCCLQALQFEGVRTWHNRLLNAYIDSDQKLRIAAGFTCRAWWSEKCSRDPYLRFNVCRHLSEAGLQEELMSLLLHPNWTLGQLQTSGILQLEQDFDTLIDMIEKDGFASNLDRVHDLRMISQAARLSCSYVHLNSTEFWFQMYNRLLPLKEGSVLVASYLDDLERSAPTPWAKPLQSCLPSPGGPLLSTIVCEARVNCFVLFGNAGFAACGCADGSIFIMEVESGCVASIVGTHDDQVTCLSMAKKEKMLLTGSEDATVRQWDLSAGLQIGNSLRGHTQRVSCVAVTRNGPIAVSGSFDSSICIWNLEDGSLLTSIQDKAQHCVRSLTISEDETRFFSGGDDGLLHTWLLHTGAKCREPLKGHSRDISCMVLLRESILLTGSSDGTICMWDVGSGKQLSPPIRGHRTRVLHLTTSADNQKFVSVSRDKTVRVWDANTTREVCDALRGHTRRVTCAAIFPDGERIVTASFDRTMRVWHAASDFTSRRPIRGHMDWIRCFAATPDGSRFVTGSVDATARVWDTQSGKEVCSVLERHSSWINCVALTPDGQRLVTGSQDGTSQLWDIESGTAIAEAFCGHEGPVTCITVSEDGNCIVTGSKDLTARVWRKREVSTFSSAVLNLHTDAVTRVALSKDDRLLVTGSADMSAIVWSLDTMNPLRNPLRGHSREVTCLTFSNGHERVVTGSKDKTVRVWTTDEEESDCTVLAGHSKGITRVYIPPHAEDMVISLSIDNTVRVWNMLNSTCVRVIDQPAARFLPLQELYLLVEDGLPDSEVVTSVRCEGIRILMEQDAEIKHIATMESQADVGFASVFRSIVCILTWNHHVVFLRLLE